VGLYICKASSQDKKGKEGGRPIPLAPIQHSLEPQPLSYVCMLLCIHECIPTLPPSLPLSLSSVCPMCACMYVYMRVVAFT
jgi:hypothetical protein